MLMSAFIRTHPAHCHVGLTARDAGSRLTVVMLVLALSGCAGTDSAAPAGNAPSYMPANATPPTITQDSNEIVGPVWRWQRTQMADGSGVTPGAPERYSVTFAGGGRVDVRADCNRGTGSYEVTGSTMKIRPATLTKIGCPPDSREAEFVRDLPQVTGYTLRNGELILALPNGGAMYFRP
jgi:heat shock protein HslJ